LKREVVVRICRSSRDGGKDESGGRARKNFHINHSSTSAITYMTLKEIICSLVHQEHCHRSSTWRGRERGGSIGGNGKVVF
jgi:hypothetical protein